MKKPVQIIVTLSLFTPLFALAQNTVHNVDIYVSKQNPPLNNIIASGSRAASADEGRVINIGIFNVQGPITIEPMTYTLNGPACPTYTPTGARIPANPLPANTATFTGTVKMEAANIPEPGNLVVAEFSGKDNGFWTKCSNGVQTPFNQVETAKLKIHSINLVLNQRNAFVCRNAQTQITVQARYPAAGIGNITWVSRNGKVTVTNGTDNGCTLNYLASGNDELVATLTVNGAVYKQTVVLEVGEIKFAQAVSHYLAPADDEIDVTTLLHANSIQNNLDWFYRYNGGPELALANVNINRNWFRAGDRLEVIAKKNGMAACRASTTLRFYYMDLSVPTWVVCDGAQLPFTLTIRPAVTNALRNQLLGTVAGLTPKSRTTIASQGNPIGHTNLTFAAFNAAWASRIDNMIWYANAANQCNNTSDYNLWVEGTINGKAISSFIYTVRANLGRGANGVDCVNGSAYPIQEWSGLPDIRTRWDPRVGMWCGFINNVGTFRRDVIGTTTNTALPTSQWRALVQAEENYHVGQMELTNGSVVCATMWNPVNVFAGIMPRCWYASTQLNARALMWHVFLTRRNLESARSWAQFAYPSPGRCALEREAKVQVGVTHRFKFSCAYPLCPQP